MLSSIRGSGSIRGSLFLSTRLNSSLSSSPLLSILKTRSPSFSTRFQSSSAPRIEHRTAFPETPIDQLHSTVEQQIRSLKSHIGVVKHDPHLEVSVSKHFDTWFNTTLDDLGLKAKGLDWRNDVIGVVTRSTGWTECTEEGKRQREKTVRRLVEGRGTSSTNKPTTTVDFLRGIRTSETLSSFHRDVPPLLKLVRSVLQLRQLEAEADGRIFDPNASLLLTNCRDFDFLVQHLDSNSSLFPSPPPSTSSSIAFTTTPATIRTSDGRLLTPTREQQAFINSSKEPGITILSAHAGTGKSTAILGFAKSLISSSPVAPLPADDHRELPSSTSDAKSLPPFLGLVSTRRLRNEHVLRSQDLGEWSTIDSFVGKKLWQEFGSDYLQKFREVEGKADILRPLDWEVVGRLLELSGEHTVKSYPIPGTTERARVPLKIYLEKVRRTFELFCQTADVEIKTKHAPSPTPKHPQIAADELVNHARRLKRRIFDMKDSQAPLTFDASKKFLQLHANLLASVDIPSVVVVDEAQDLNECELDLVQSLAKDRLLVLAGDPLQSIFPFKGTTSRWIKLPNAEHYQLSQTLRFGRSNAAVVNEFLIASGERENLVVGCDKREEPTVVYRSSYVGDRAGSMQLYEGYNQLFRRFLTILVRFAASKLPKMELLLASRFDEAQPLRLFQHGAHLFLALPFNDRSGSDHLYPSSSPYWCPSLAEFNTWKEFNDEYRSWSQLPTSDKHTDWRTLAEAFDVQEPESLARAIVRRKQSVKAALNTVDGDAKRMYSIPHQVKGLEFESVLHRSPFREPQYPPYATKTTDYQRNLRHVSLTRSNGSLELCAADTEFLAKKWGLHHFRLVDDPNLEIRPTRACSTCGHFSDYDLIAYSTPLPHHPQHMAQAAPLSKQSPSSPAESTSSRRFSRSNFPICTTCARKSDYRPLRELAEYVEGIEPQDEHSSDLDTRSLARKILSPSDEQRNRQKQQLRDHLARTEF